MARRGRNFRGNQQNQNYNNNNNNNQGGNYNQNGRNQNYNNNNDNNYNGNNGNNNRQGNRQNSGQSNGPRNDNQNFRGNQRGDRGGSNRGNFRGGYQGKRPRYDDDDQQNNDNNNRNRPKRRNWDDDQQDGSSRPLKKQKWQDRQDDMELDEYEQKYGKNPIVARLRETSDMLIRTHPSHKMENLYAADKDVVMVPAPTLPKFGFERDWKQDDFLARFVANAMDYQALSARILNLPDQEQIGILKFMFITDELIPVGNRRYSPNGAFQYSYALNNLLQGQDKLGKWIAQIFYTQNVFYFHEPFELVNFVVTTPTESLQYIRKIVLGSPLIRRAPGARESVRGHRTQEDLDIERALKMMPGLQIVAVKLGWDINDSWFRIIMSQDWCANHPSVPSLLTERRSSHTILHQRVLDISAAEVDDAAFAGVTQVRLDQMRQKKLTTMDTS